MEKKHEFYQLYLWHSLLISRNHSNFPHLQFLANLKIVKEMATCIMGDSVSTAASPVSRFCLLAWKDMQPLCSVGDLPFLLISSGPRGFLWRVLLVPISCYFAPSLFSKNELERLSPAPLSFSFLLGMC